MRARRSGVSARTVIVVGAGAAGLTAALRAAEAGARVVLLNAHPKVGLKILMSGGTRCNVTHREVSERDFNAGSRPFVARVLRAFTAEQTRAWFESLGVRLKLEPSGKYFPETDDARTVLDALVGAVAGAGVEVRSGARVVRIERGSTPGDHAEAGEPPRPAEAAPWRLGIQHVAASAVFSSEVAGYRAECWPLPAAEPDEWLEADAVVLATGGLSFPRTGSDGSGYGLAASLGHTLVPPVPALTPLVADDPLCRAAQGVALEAALTLAVGGKRAVTVTGSLLVAHFGYSGPAALDLSRHWLRAEGRGERRVLANFLPGETAESLAGVWLHAARFNPRVSVRRWLGERVPDSLAVQLCAEAEIEPGTALAQVPRERRATLIERVTARVLPVTGTLGYEKAEVTAGGVALAEVDPSTLESRKAPGIFLCGEVLDVDGRLGGFNFQWAWSSGTVAGRATAHSLLRFG
ncbi:MAG: aminoacetone oxidase family FAD-binding enzyme [Candidatus Eisenbacteria bacterium]|nr:aminoacetone oxidase family FAD-binding enzyme [Candidatus Eisenbacteria bacterium]